MPHQDFDLSHVPFWPTQSQAINTARAYIAAGITDRASLIQMPTGTGKSGVIAALAKGFPDTPHVLVISPFAALRDQLARDIRERFWSKLRVQGPNRPVKVFLPSEINALLEVQREQCVYVCTVQTLQDIHNDPLLRPAYNSIRDLISLVIFDEGHREPAPTWAQAVRNLGKPTVLLTATPYRNDHNFLQISPEHKYVLSHQEAYAERYIRKVCFVPNRFAMNPSEFVDQLLEFYDGPFANEARDYEPRVIIRCESEDSVRDIHRILTSHHRSAVAIHEELTPNDDRSHFRTVPSPDGQPAIFWVHQYKLIEGIDDPRFSLLAIYEPLKNGRALVQQIGRVLRNPQRLLNQNAYVFCHPDHYQKEYWDNYLQYEVNPGKASITEILDAAQSGIQYFEGNFRESFDWKEPGAYKHLNYRLSANVFEPSKRFQYEVFKTKLLEEWTDKKRSDVVLHSPDGSSGVCIYCSFRNSPILNDHMFLEYELGFTVFKLSEGLLFYYDSQGLTPDYLRDRTRRLSPQSFLRLFPKEARISQLSLMNSDLGQHSVRRRSMSAFSVAETAPSLGDHAQVCSTAEGSIRTDGTRQIRRYVGFSRGRVSDRFKDCHTFIEFCEWADVLARQFRGKADGSHRLFRRFATYAAPPSDPTPTNILLDVDDASALFKDAKGEYLAAEDLCADIVGGSFSVVVNKTPVAITISYDANRAEYALDSEQLNSLYTQVEREGKKEETLTTYLNRRQSFRLALKPKGYLYSHGHFYSTQLGLGGDLDLSRILITVDALKGLTEKGKDGTATALGWSKDSIFHILDTRGVGTEMESYMQAIRYMVCDDLESEIADFIAVTEDERKVIFIHAKAKHGELSASDFADVCSQAVKNLDYLHHAPSKDPTRNIAKWDGVWKKSDAEIVDRRVRHGDLTGQQMWDKIQTVLRDPNADREVWIVMGDNLSIEEFDTERAKAEPKPQVIQIYYQLSATWASVAAVGAKLKVFCRR